MAVKLLMPKYEMAVKLFMPKSVMAVKLLMPKSEMAVKLLIPKSVLTTKLFMPKSDLIDVILFIVLNATFSTISTISWRPILVVEKLKSTWREPPTMDKQLVNFITCSCKSSAPFFVIYKAERKPTSYW